MGGGLLANLLAPNKAAAFGTQADTPFIGEIMIAGFNYAPRGWAMCEGQILSIAQNTALFSLLGTTYGGNGQTTFALPDLRGRVPIHFNQGPGLSYHSLGERSGAETHTLITTEMPAHIHTGSVALPCNTGQGTSNSPVGNVLAADGSGLPQFHGTANGTMGGAGSVTTNPAGGSQPHNNMQPYLALNFCIALEGIYPSRN
ncbi:phage tail protein [Hymenobacter rigui]|uniref:Phage tail protein n=2 Tax=Hymenobacter rigui TaxID=334424 RepID=A0A428KNU2_9BACT|nr:phage tail protein [Hymenobacter rigui]